MSPLRLTVFGLALVVGSVLCAEDAEDALEELQCKLELQRVSDDLNKDGAQASSGAGSRKKRQAFGYYNYNALYPSYSRFIGDGALGDALYNPLAYGQRLPFLPDYGFSRLNTLPIFRFFNRFYPAQIVNSNEVLVRNYARFGTRYADAYADFRALPVENVQQISSTSVVNGVSALRANIVGIQGSVVRLLPNGCGLEGFNVGVPCLTLSLPSTLPGRRYQNVLRRFIYFGGLGTGLGVNRVVSNTVVA